MTSSKTPSHTPPQTARAPISHGHPRYHCAAAGLAATLLLCTVSEPLVGQEYRAWWVDGWGAGFLNQSQVDTLLGVPGNPSSRGTIREANCNAVIVQVRRRFDTCYPSGVGEPYMSGLSPTNFNALAAMIKAAHDTTGGKKRIEVHCWSVVFKTAKGLVYTQHSDPNNPENYWPTRLGSTSGEENADGAFDPGHPKVLEYLVNAHLDLLNFQTTAGPDGTDGHIDGIHYDYVRFEANTEGFNPTSVARYNARYGLTGEPSPSDEQFKQWRRDQVTAFVRQMYARIQKTKPWIKQSGAFVTWNPSPTASTRAAFRATRPYYDVYSDWDSWMEEGIVDLAVPMTYYNWASLPNDYTRWMNFEKDRRFNRQMVIGPGTYLNSLSNAILELQMTRNPSPAGNYAEGFSGYSYRVPYSGGTWAGFSPSLVTQVTTNWAEIPPMPWKTSPTKGHVMGTVTIGATGAWADHAIVTLSGPVSKSQYVDGTGFYAFIDLPPGTYNLTASLNGFSPAAATVTVAIGQVTGNMYEQNFALSAGGPPVITAQPESLTVAQGSNATFSVSVGGTAPFGYQWRFNEADLAGATAASFTRSNAQPAHGGDYTVVISNPVGSVTSSVATLTVIVPPAITTHPQSQSVTQGVNVAFSVVASGTAPFGYQWRFNGSPISGATQSAFALNNVQPSDAGNYSVIVSNFAGTATSANAALTVYPVPLPPSILDEPLDVVAAAGQTVSFQVTANGAEPLVYQWRFNNTNLPGATSNPLLLAGVQTNQAGGYSVVITNAYGAVTSRTALLTVNPTFVATGLKVLWSLAPGSRSYLTFTSPPNERGLAYNPVSRHLIVVNRTAPSVHVLEADTGSDLWTMNTSGISGGYSSSYYLLMVGVADDGAVYAGNLTINGTTTDFKLYRWADDNPATAPTVAYAGDPGAGTAHRWGDTLDVRGSGTDTQIIISSRAGNAVAVLTTSNGLTFSSKLIVVPDAPAGAFGLGTAFGAGNTFWGKATSQNLRQVAFDLVSGTGTTLRNHPAPDFPATIAPIGVSTSLNLLGGINVGVTGNDFRLYDLLLDNTPPQFIASTNFATDNDNTYTGTGAVDFGGDRVYALGSGNGIVALQIVPATPAPLAPSIVLQPEPQAVKWTSNATFTVLASGTEPLAYQWQFNSTNLPGATASHYTRSHVQYSDAGPYRVLVTNIAGAATSQPAMLTIVPPQPARFQQIKILPDGRIDLLWSGEPGWSYTLQITTNADFLNWLDRGPISGSNGWFNFIDDDAVNAPQRFYRTRQ